MAIFGQPYLECEAQRIAKSMYRIHVAVKHPESSVVVFNKSNSSQYIVAVDDATLLVLPVPSWEASIKVSKSANAV
jgi:hypothetical protein